MAIAIIANSLELQSIRCEEKEKKKKEGGGDEDEKEEAEDTGKKEMKVHAQERAQGQGSEIGGQLIRYTGSSLSQNQVLRYVGTYFAEEAWLSRGQ